ncbi:hypothetical protein TNCV_1838331 [Trichonephila clavipes]|nr:hypothetical protein TNCV_1838331 [Trichonephila clavipes]
MNQVLLPQNQMNQAVLPPNQINLMFPYLIEVVNIIKNIIFEHLKDLCVNIHLIAPTNLTELWTALAANIWQVIPVEFFQKLVESMLCHMAAVFKVKGGPTPYKSQALECLMATRVGHPCKGSETTQQRTLIGQIK